MEGGFCEYCLTGKEWLGDVFGNIHGPAMVVVSLTPEGNDEARVGNGLHLREKPFLEDKSGGPLIFPAKRRKR